ncbi:MAG: hypothetical protein GY943_26425 [Chloroflexi bacterium]|nr:hypothetical protein [Chloroflexota bacterium]
MEKNVLALFNDNILHESARRFNINPDSLQLLSDMENFVYEGIAENTPIILRITHSSHRTTDAILAELDWLTHLHANRLSVPQSIYSTDEQLIEVVDSAHSYFLITAFQKLEGANIIDENLCTQEK